MRLLINAVGLRAGGGLTVGLNCVRGIREVRPDYEIMALVPAGCGYEEQCATLGIPFKRFRTTPLYALWRLWFDQVQVPSEARQWGADVLFSMNNQAAWAVGCPQVVLLHNAYSIYPVADWWSLLGPFDRTSLLLQRALFAVIAPRRGARVAVQTPVAARRLEERYGIPRSRLAVVPNAIAAEHHGPETDAGRRLAVRMRAAARGRTAVLTLARYYPHKDLEFILRVARALRERGDQRFAFFITIAAQQHPGARALLARIEREDLAEDVVNLGPIDFGELRSAYDVAEICFLPTMLESMSGTHLEALHYQLPIVTTQRDFARDACGTAAHYFSIGDVDAAIRQLHAVVEAPARRVTRPISSRSWNDVCQELGTIIDAARLRPAGGTAHVEVVSSGTQIR